MSFTSTAFLLFLPIVLGLYWLLRRHLRWQNGLVVVASYFFYGWWDWRFLLLIALTSACSYASGLAMDATGGEATHLKNRQRLLCRGVAAANIILNLGILTLFKYFNFFAESFCDLLRMVGFHADAPTLRLILPVGISFYTFQALSYTIDVYRGRIPATRDAVAFFAYISFFPQLVAGPIERATQLLPQMLRARTFIYSDAVDGLRQMLWGFFKKVVVADTCAMAVNEIWADQSAQSSLALALGAVLFSIQIYGDFSGYSDIAVGCARLFGIRLMQNFRYPYFASNVADFWRRWHISLMTWLRDYVYIPLGGSRCSARRAAFNVLIVFLASGLWHGAAWTFVLWGLYHALLLIAEKYLTSPPPQAESGAVQRSKVEGQSSKFKVQRSKVEGQSSKFKVQSSKFKVQSSKFKVQKGWGWILTFALVTFGWILFRAPSIGDFATYMHHLFTQGDLLAISSFMGKRALGWSLIMLGVEWLQRRRTHGLDLPAVGLLRHRAVRWAIYYVLIGLILFCNGQSQTFIYFQF